jgi:hypothetical protein
MKKILALGLAAAMATATIGITAETASAQPKNWNNDWNWKKNNWKGNNWNGNGNWRRHNNWRGGNFVLPFVLGGALGYGLSQGYGYPGPYYNQGPAYGYGDPHEQWCAAHYRTYNPVTNTFFVRPGVARVCVSPYGPY